jgi:hypothetical protein
VDARVPAPRRSELKAAGRRLGEVFTGAVTALGARQRFIRARRPDSNGCVERLGLTFLAQCWRPAFARSLAPKTTALERDLDEYLPCFDFDRANTGRLTKGRVLSAPKTRTGRRARRVRAGRVFARPRGTPVVVT